VTVHGRVVVGVHDGDSATAALRRAALEARRSRRPLLVVHAWGPPEGEALHRAAPCPPLAAEWRARAGAVFADLLEDSREHLAGLEWEPLLVRADPAYALTRLAGPDDLLVIGGGGRGRLARLLRGRVRRATLAGARCPVLTVARPALTLADRADLYLAHRLAA